MGCCGKILTPIIDKAKQLEERLKRLAAVRPSAKLFCRRCGKPANGDFCSTNCKQQHLILEEMRR
jgi:hypothetical protein